MELFRCNANDVKEIARLEKACIECPWTEENLLSSLNSDNCVIIKAVEDGAVVGYGGVEIVLDEGNILNVAVDSAFRRKGIASAIMTELARICKEKGVCAMFLEVNETNAGAITLYEKNGYEVISTRPRYYGEHSAIIMKKSL